jgi:hypothetical protein
MAYDPCTEEALEGLIEEYKHFLEEDLSEGLQADGPFPMYGILADGHRLHGHLYRSKHKHVPIVVFVGMPDPTEAKYGRLFMYSSGRPGTTRKGELPEGFDLGAMLHDIATWAEDDPEVLRADDYCPTFFANVVREFGFAKGLFVPLGDGTCMSYQTDKTDFCDCIEIPVDEE